MEGGNGASETSVVTLCSKRAYQTDVAKNLHGWRLSRAPEKLALALYLHQSLLRITFLFLWQKS